MATALTITPGTLTDVKYPASAQTLLERFANAMYAPTAARSIYTGASMSGPADGSTLWFNSTKKTLNFYDGGLWKASLEGNTTTASNTSAFTYAATAISSLSTAQAAGTGTAVVSVSFTPRSLNSKILISAHIPCISASVATTIVAMIFRTNSTSLQTAYQSVTLNGFTNINMVFAETATSIAATTYQIRVGALAACTLSFNRSTDGTYTNMNAPAYIAIQEISEP